MSKKRIYVALILALAMTLSVLTAGCGMIAEKASEKATEKAIENATGGDAKVDLNNGNVEVKTQDGSFKAGAVNEWPKTMPSDVPKMDSGDITSVMESNNDNGKGTVIAFEKVKDDSITKYKSDLEKAGWKITMTSTGNDSSIISAEKEKRNVLLTFSGEKDNRSGGITYSEEQ